MKSKKAIATIMALILAFALVAFAQAADIETRERTVMMEGTEEKVTEARYVSPYGYELWYELGAFELVSEPEDGYDEFIPVDPDALPPVSVSIIAAELTPEEADGLFEEVVADHREAGYDMSEEWAGEMESGLEYRASEGLGPDDEIVRFYLVKGKQRLYTVSAIFPMAAAEGYGTRSATMIETMKEVD